MGHYYAEMFPDGEDKTFDQRWADYQKACAIEISNLVRNNPIKPEEINIGDELTLYFPLKELSKIRFDNRGEFHRIRDLFGCRAKVYSFEMWTLYWADNFKIYDKREVKDNLENKTFPQVRIDKPRIFDFPQFWVNIQYFEKK